MSVEKTNDAHAPASVAVPPCEPNPGFQTPVPIQPDHAQPQYMDTFAPQQPQLPQQHENQQQMQQQKYPIATPLHALQSAPAPVDCTSCHQREMTQIQFESGKTTHGWAAVLCCCLCIGCLPYMMSSLKDARHHCAKCGVWLATWHNSGRVEIASAPPRKK